MKNPKRTLVTVMATLLAGCTQLSPSLIQMKQTAPTTQPEQIEKEPTEDEIADWEKVHAKPVTGSKREGNIKKITYGALVLDIDGVPPGEMPENHIVGIWDLRGLMIIPQEGYNGDITRWGARTTFSKERFTVFISERAQKLIDRDPIFRAYANAIYNKEHLRIMVKDFSSEYYTMGARGDIEKLLPKDPPYLRDRRQRYLPLPVITDIPPQNRLEHLIENKN